MLVYFAHVGIRGKCVSKLPSFHHQIGTRFFGLYFVCKSDDKYLFLFHTPPLKLTKNRWRFKNDPKQNKIIVGTLTYKSPLSLSTLVFHSGSQSASNRRWLWRLPPPPAGALVNTGAAGSRLTQSASLPTRHADRSHPALSDGHGIVS